MHSNILTLAICAFAIPASVTARPNVNSLSARSIQPVAGYAHPISVRRRSQRAQLQEAAAAECATPAAEAAAGEKQKGAAAGNKQKEAVAGEQQKGAAAEQKQKEAVAEQKQKEAAAEQKQKEAAQGEAAAGEEAAGGEEEAKENEVEIESAFDAAVPVQGGELKQDLVFTPSTVGKFEYEFQSAAADEITVTENAGAAAAAPPTGFEAIEPNSYTVALSVSKGAGLTLSKIDYIFDAALVAGKDVTQAQVGRLCAETGSFVISETLGELEFELEENEVTLNLNKNVTAEGQWGIFIPVAAGAAAGNATGEAGAGEKEKAAAEKEKAAAEQEKAAAEKEKAAAEKEKATAEKEKKQQEKAAAEAANKEKAATEAAMKEKVAAEAAMEKKAATEAAAQQGHAQQQKSALAALLAAAQREQPAAGANAMAH